MKITFCDLINKLNVSNLNKHYAIDSLNNLCVSRRMLFHESLTRFLFSYYSRKCKWRRDLTISN